MMRTTSQQAELSSLSRRAGPFYAAATPVTIVDAGAREIASFRSPRKMGKALVSGEIVLIAGDVIHIGGRRVVS
jgi:hypothetical protein